MPCNVGCYNAAVQELLVIDDLLSAMVGIEGRYISIKSVTGKIAGFTFQVDPSMDLALQELATRVFSLCESFLLIEEFVESRSQFKKGLVNHAFAAALRALLLDYQAMVAQLEHQFRLRRLSLQGLWFYCQPFMSSLRALSSVIQKVSSNNYEGVDVLNLLQSQAKAMAGDHAVRSMLEKMIQWASSAYLGMLERWVYEGVIEDPYGEFFIAENKSLQKESLTQDYDAKYWQQRYSLKDSIPSFLSEVSGTILTTGKYLNVMRECGHNVQVRVEENSKLRSFGTNHHYLECIKGAYDFASGELLNLIKDKYDLMGKLRSIKHYLLPPSGSAGMFSGGRVCEVVPSNFYRRISSLPTTTTTPTDLNDLLNIVLQTTRKTIKHAGQIHGQIVVNGYTRFPFLLNSLLKLYAECGHIAKSMSLFSKMDDDRKTIVSWTTLITQLSRHAMPFEALAAFKKMMCSGLDPNHFTFSAVLPACASTLDPLIGRQIHGLVCKHRFKDDVYVGSALIDTYAKCFDMGCAEKVFDEMPDRNLVTWNSMIVGYLENRLYDDAILSFKGVLRELSLSPDDVSFSSVLNACANIGGGRLITGKQIHGLVIKRGLVALPYVKNTLMDMYNKCGSVGDASKLFTITSDKDVVAWNVMIMGFVKSESFEKACDFFWTMRKKGVSPDEVSFSTALHACANIAALNQGVLIHNQVIKTGFMTNVCISSALVTMYGKCGSLVDAHRVFDEIVNCNVICWTAMIAAFQQHGCASQAIQLFERMLQEGTEPEYITFVCVLSACGHTGKVEEGYSYFNSMTSVHNTEPGPEHYACMVDLLGRVGRLEEAMKFIESMPMKPGPSVWGALLSACRNHKNLEIGKIAAEKLLELEPTNSGNYVMLANMYARDGKMKEADEIRRLMGINGVKKEPGCSWIDMKNSTFVFTANDRSNSRTDEIYEMLAKLKELATEKGYLPDTQFAVNDAEEYKERSLWYHSEKLALAFGLLELPAKAPIRIKKNLRSCGDCHTVMKFASEIFDREIIVRDINRFHHFANGSCSCGDYW